MSMNDQTYTTLAYLAQAIVAEPDLTDEFAEAVKDDVTDATSEIVLDGPELFAAVDAINMAWAERKAQAEADGDPVTFDDIIEIARHLSRDGDEVHRIASLALVSAAQDFLSRKLREDGLSPEERELARELPGIVPSATLAHG